MSNNFNYLDYDLVDWADAHINTEVTVDQALRIVRDQYLPEFEAAIWRLASENV